MEEKQTQGSYVEAETCRKRVEELKKDYEARRLYELKQKQKKEARDLEDTHKE